MRIAIYWAARTALFFAVFVALWSLGARNWLAVVGAMVIAWLISYAMFGSMYDAAAQQMERLLGFTTRPGRDEPEEDAEADGSNA